jgi:CRISPR-associated endonuclease Cas1
MGWRTVVVNKHGKLSYKNNHLIYKSAERSEMLHLSEIDLLLCETTDITITTMLLAKLTDEGVDVIFCDEKRLPSSHLATFYGRHDSSLQINRQIGWDSSLSKKVWTEIIFQKIDNQRKFLSYHSFDDKSCALGDLLENLEILDPTNREGHAARIYFNTLFGTDFTRDTDNNINAGLDYGYTLLMSIFAREISACGCLTQLGLKHNNQFNDFNLASDLMEPFRVLVDDIVYEHRDKSFKIIRRELFEMFARTYVYTNKEMFLTNIISDYVKKIIQVLNGTRENTPRFGI